MRLGFRIVLGKERRNRFMAARYNHPGIWGYRAMLSVMLPENVRLRMERSLRSYRLQLQRVYEAEVRKVIREATGELFVDVGANIGLHSMTASQNFCKVYAFEPHPPSADFMEAVLKKRGIQNVTLYRMAVSDGCGHVFLHLSPNPGGHSLISAVPGKTPMTRNRIEVPVTTLTWVLRAEDEIDLIKVDVEGVEKKVIWGAIPLMEKVKAWIVEIHDTRIMEKRMWSYYFRHFGYQVKWLDENHIYAWRA